MQNRGLLCYFCFLWQNCPSHHNTAFDVNAVENAAGQDLKPHNYVSWNSALYCLRTTTMSAQNAGSQATAKTLMQIWISQMLQENEAQLWKPVSCRHPGNWEREWHVCLRRELNTRLRSCWLWHEKWACSPRRRHSQPRLPCWVLSNQSST